MLELLFKNVLIMGTLISICSLPIVFLINNKRTKYNVKAVYNLYCILAVMLIIPIGITIFNNVNLRINTSIEVSDNNIDDYNVEFENENIIFDGQNNFRNHVIENNAIYNFIKYGSVIWIDIALLYWIYTMINYYAYIKSLKIYADTDLMIENYLKILKKEFKLKYKVKYYFSNNISTAITIGLIHKKVIIPTTNKNYSDLTYILKHEVFHIKNNDILFKNILLLVNSIYWFNPIVYYFRKISDEIIELNCDYNILKDKPEEYRIQYGKVLLNQLVISRKSKYVLITSFSDSRRNIMERFSNIVKYDKNKKIMFIAVAIILMLITASGVIYAFNNVSVEEEKIEERNDEIVNENTNIDTDVENDKILEESFDTNDVNNVVEKDTVEIENIEEAKNAKTQELKENTNSYKKEQEEKKNIETTKVENITATSTVVEDEKKETPAIKEESSQKEIGKIFDYPIPGARITTRYGQVNGASHTGMDFAAEEGTEIRAVADGIVVLSKYKGSYGYMVMIDHGNGLNTLYCHCQESPNVSEGQSIKKGEVIAKVGSTGNTTGPALHFEVRENNIPKNPENYLK